MRDRVRVFQPGVEGGVQQRVEEGMLMVGAGGASTSRGGGQGGGSRMRGERQVHAVKSRARRASVKYSPQLAYQMHRDVNAAWNLWEVGVALYAGNPRPAYLSQSHS